MRSKTSAAVRSLLVSAAMHLIHSARPSGEDSRYSTLTCWLGAYSVTVPALIRSSTSLPLTNEAFETPVRMSTLPRLTSNGRWVVDAEYRVRIGTCTFGADDSSPGSRGSGAPQRTST